MRVYIGIGYVLADRVHNSLSGVNSKVSKYFLVLVNSDVDASTFLNRRRVAGGLSPW